MDISELGLTTKASVIREAKAIATHHFGKTPVSAKECPFQGYFSHTVNVGMRDGSHYVVQLRSESVHEENAQQGHEILGDLVPVPIRVIREGSPVPYAYIMPHVSGSTWLTRDTRGWELAKHVKVVGQIGDMIGKCCGHKQSTESDIIDSFIIPHLQLYLEWDEPSVAPYKGIIKSLLDKVDDLRKLPVALAHWDLNQMNIMVSDDGNVVGVLDWEETYWMPFGMNTCIISELAAFNQRGVLHKRDCSDEMEEAFWRSLFLSAPLHVRSMLKEIQLAKDIGLIIRTFVEGTRPPHPSHVGVLSDSFLYKVPEDVSSLIL
jgi:hypothetical protein